MIILLESFYLCMFSLWQVFRKLQDTLQVYDQVLLCQQLNQDVSLPVLEYSLNAHCLEALIKCTLLELHCFDLLHCL